MASPQASDHFATKNLVQVWDHDPGDTAANVTTPDGGTTERWVDMRDYGGLSVIVATTVLGGNGPTLVEIVAADDTSGTNITVIKTSGVVAPDALGDWVYEECTAEEIAQESADASASLRYAAARITCHHAGDEALVTYIGWKPRFPRDALTAATTIA